MAAVCRVVLDLCKRPDEKPKRGFDLTNFCARFRLPDTIYEAADTVRPLPLSEGGEPLGATGFEFVAGTAGLTADKLPKLKGPVGNQVLDGGLTWTAQAVSEDSLIRNVVSVAWTAEAPMTVTGAVVENTGGRVQIAALHGGGLDGSTYRTEAEVTFDDASIEIFAIDWEIKDD